ncbi:hypothetical protein [Archangium sp.]|uniref:hypothetical protein n=1 Tax=Archangium sp. TaxID=1872627 RepID=UPI002D28B4C0|nr:hypothetical protein [Archangium sp.]HYO59833.1 hypothetical protein [Archangium sp.]
MDKAAKALLVKLAQTRSLDEARQYVGALVKEHKFTWRPVGDRENNYGSINIGSDPGHAFVERVTNAIDAVIEREALRWLAKTKGAKQKPATPREAVESWFKVPGGRVSNVGLPLRQKLANNVVVMLLDSKSKRQPTVEIRDLGVGLTPKLVPGTILSLGAENKINKTYLAGAYGQGGSTALSFSPHGCTIVSRRHSDLIAPGDEDLVAVTFVKFNEMDLDVNKNGRYEYLVMPDKQVAGIQPKLLDFEPGTSVIHFNLDIPQYSERLTQLTRSMWWLLQNTMFDPVLPIWAEEHRQSVLKGDKDTRRTIAGNFTRLMDDKKGKVEHDGSIRVELGHAGGDTSVQVNYWVLKSDPEKKGASPIDAYVDLYKPITYTFFGQTHGTDDRRFIAERLSLPHLAKYLIIQVELDRLTAHARRELLSTTRDRLKQLSFYTLMREQISTALSQDEDLIRLNEARKDEILSKHSEQEQAKMQERFARLMERFKAGVDVTASGKGAGDKGRKTNPPGRRESLAPLPTKDKPTFIRIANTQKPLPLRLERHAVLQLESDAPDGYISSHVHAQLLMVSEPDGIVGLGSTSDFKGGRSRMVVSPTEKAKAGDTGTLRVFLITPEGKQFSDKIGFKVDVADVEPTSGDQGKSKVQVPKPVPIHKDEWAKMGGWDETSVAETRDNEIYVNMDNRHISKLLRSGNYLETGVTRMSRNYLLYIAFYAYVQHVATANKDLGLEAEAYEKYVQAELDRVAQTVVHAISSEKRMEEED